VGVKKIMRIKPVVIDGQERVHPETMDLLVRMGEHRKLCSTCNNAMEDKTGNYCKTGVEFIRQLELRPDVDFVDPSALDRSKPL
jgi:recombinational DNA repair protein RecR